MQAFNGLGGWRFVFCFIESPKLKTGIDGSPIGKGGSEGIMGDPVDDVLFWEFIFNDSSRLGGGLSIFDWWLLIF